MSVLWYFPEGKTSPENSSPNVERIGDISQRGVKVLSSLGYCLCEVARTWSRW